MNVFRRLALSAVVSLAVGMPVMSQAQSCGVPPPMDVLLFVDNSGSISNVEFDAAQQAIAQIATDVLSRPGYRLAVVNWACQEPGNVDASRDGCRIDLATGSAIPGGWSSNPAAFAYVGSNSASNRVCRSFGQVGPSLHRNNCGGANFTAAVPSDFAQHALKMLEGAMYSGGGTGGTDSNGAATVGPGAPSPTNRLMVIHMTDGDALASSRIREVPVAESALGNYYYSNRFKNVRNALMVGVGIDSTTLSTAARNELGAFSSRGGTSTNYDTAHQIAPSTATADIGAPRLATFSDSYNAAQILAATSSALAAAIPACVVLRKQTVGGVGSFNFTGGTNGLPGSLTLTTTAPNTPVSSSAYILSGFNTDTGIQEVTQAGWALSGASCVNASNASVPVTANASTGQITIPGVQITAGAQLTCTVTNTRVQPDFGTCDARMFLDQVNSAGTVSTLYNVGYASSPFAYISLGADSARNGLAYNPLDNYLYGIEWVGFSGNELIRVGADGSSANLGVITGLPAANYNNGVISPAGDYYLKSGQSTNILYRVNIATRTAAPITLSSPIQVSDFAWHNGRLYAIQSSQLISVDPVSGVVTTIGPVGLGGAIAMWGFSNGLFATNGDSIYAIDPATGANTLASTAPSSNNADGANCPTAAIMLNADLSVTKTNTPASGPEDLANDTYVPGSARTYTIVVRNAGPYGVQNAVVSDPVPAGIDPGAVSWTCTPTSGAASCGAASGTGALNDPGLDLPMGASATYRIAMTVPASFTGTLTNTVTVTQPSNITDINTANNTATDVDQSTPRLTIRKISVGGVDSFGFTGTNGVVAQTLTTTTAGTPVSGAVRALTAASTVTTITESPTPATYRVSNITCTGLGAGGTATPDLANRTVALDAAATAMGANIECTFTNSLQQTDLQVVKAASPDLVVSGDVVTYQIVVTNNGPLAADGAVLTDVAGVGQDCTMPSTTATCAASGGASCPSATIPVSSLLGAGVTLPTLPVGGQITFGLQCTVTASGL